jgi:hypothetical protein
MHKQWVDWYSIRDSHYCQFDKSQWSYNFHIDILELQMNVVFSEKRVYENEEMSESMNSKYI